MTAYEVTSNHVPPYAGSGLPVTEVIGILHRLDPAAVQEAGAAHTTLGRELDTMAADLTREAHTLAQSWSGRAARTALAQFQRLREQTTTLSAQATQTGAVLTWLGTQVLPSFKDLTDPSQAQKYLTELSSALVLANRSLPAQIGGSVTVQLASAATPDPDARGSSPGGPPSSGPAHPASSINPASPNSAVSPGNPTSTNVPDGLIGPTTSSGIPGGPTSPAAPLSSTAPTGTTSTSATAGPAGPGGHTSPSASRLQSAAPVPASGAPASPAGPSAPAAPSAATTGSPAPVPLVTTASPGTTGPGRRSRPARDHDAEPSAEGAPSAHAATAASAAAPVPELPAAEAPALSTHPLPELTGLDGTGLDSGLSGGALPLPAQPLAGALPTAPAAVATPDPGGSASHGFPGGLPMTGGMSGQPDHERNRDSWATEDRNLWGLPDACVPPLIEGD